METDKTNVVSVGNQPIPESVLTVTDPTTLETLEIAPITSETPINEQTPPETPKTAETGQNEPEKAGGNQEIRDESGRFVKGVSGNPAGKPPGTRHMTTLLKEYLKTQSRTHTGEMISLDEAIVRKITEKAVKGNDKSIEMIWNHLDGKPRESVEINLTGEIINPDAKKLADKALDDYLENLHAKNTPGTIENK